MRAEEITDPARIAALRIIGKRTGHSEEEVTLLAQAYIDLTRQHRRVTVFLATSGEWDDFRVLRAFTSREDAESYKLADDVMEMELTDGPVEVRAWHTLTWRPEIPDRSADFPFTSNPFESSEERDYDGIPDRVTGEWVPSGVLNRPHVLTVGGWDLKLVRAAYRRARAAREAVKGA